MELTEQRKAAAESIIDDCIGLLEKRLRQRNLERLAQKLRPKVRSFMRQQGERVIARIRANYAKQFEQSGASAINIMLHVFDDDAELLMLAEILEPYLEQSGQLGQQYALRQLSRAIGRTISYRGSTAWIRDNAIKFGRAHAQMINEATNLAIRERIAAAIDGGKDLNWLINEIESVTRGQVYDYRAERIARTEMSRAYNMSQLIQDNVLGIDSFDWGGCSEDCLQCSAFMGGNPHTAAEIEVFILEVHPNCVGNFYPRPAPDWTPEEV